MPHRKHAAGSVPRRRAAALASCTLIGTLALAGPTKAGARPRPAPAPAPAAAQASQLIAQGVLALATRDYPTAQRALEDAYKLAPSADTLYQLGMVAWARGHAVQAHDLLRRYLADPLAQAPAAEPRRAEAQRITAQPVPASGEVRVEVEPGVFLRVDGALVGRTPLPLPLLVSVGEHQLELIRTPPLSTGNQAARIELRPAQAFAVRTDATAASGLRVDKLRTVWAVARGTQPTWEHAALGRLPTVYAELALGAVDLGAAPDPTCAASMPCLIQRAEPFATELLLQVEATPDPTPADAAAHRLRAVVVDVRVGEPASEQAQDCPHCDPDKAQRGLVELATAALTDGSRRARGTLSIGTSPAGAELELGGRPVGTAPLLLPRFAGTYQLSARAPGYRSQRRELVVKPDETTTLELKLEPEPPPIAQVQLPPPPRRPTWRLALGGTAIAVGAGLAGLGISGLVVNDQCTVAVSPPMQVCPRFYDTLGAGAGLLAGGALLAIGGAVLVALPPRPRAERTLQAQAQTQIPASGASGRAASALAAVPMEVKP